MVWSARIEVSSTALRRHTNRTLPAPGGAAFASVATVLAFVLLAFALRSAVLAAVATVAGLWLILRHLGAWSAASSSERVSSALLVLLLTLSLPVAALRQPTAIAHFAISMLALGIAFAITRDIAVYLRASAWVVWSTQVAVFAFLAVHGLDDFPLEHILPETSSNGITSYLVALQANYCIVRFLLRGRATLVTPLITLAICVVGYGRGSILAATAIVAVNAVACLDSRRALRSVALLALATALAAWIYQRHGDAVATFVEVNTKIGSGLVDQHRERQIAEYLERVDGLTLLIGAEYEGTSIASEYNNNPHNAFIRGHHIFGLGYIVLVTVLPFAMTSARLPRTRRLYAHALVVVVLFRAFTEPILFPTALDTIYFALCFVLARAAGSARQPTPTR